MKKNKLLVLSFLLLIFSLPNLFGQHQYAIDVDSLTQQIQETTDTSLNRDYYQFMLNVSSKNLQKKFYWIDKNNLIVNMYKLNYDLDSIEYHLLDYMKKDPIHLCYDIEWHKKTSFKKYMDKHKKFYAKLECRCKEEWAKLDSNLIRLLVVMDSLDQKYRKNDADAPWFPQNKDKWIEQGHYDKYNEVLLAHIFKYHNFPTYQKTGLGEIELIPFTIFLHCSTSFQEKYLPLIKVASDANNVPEHFFPQAQDRILMQKGLPQIYGTQLVWNKKAEVLELYKVKDMSKVDALRKEVGLGKLSKYLKANHAIISKTKN